MAMKRVLVFVTSLALCWVAAAVKRTTTSRRKSRNHGQVEQAFGGPAVEYPRELRPTAPDWKEIQPQAKEVAKLSAMLSK